MYEKDQLHRKHYMTSQQLSDISLCKMLKYMHDGHARVFNQCLTDRSGAHYEYLIFLTEEVIKTKGHIFIGVDNIWKDSLTFM